METANTFGAGCKVCQYMYSSDPCSLRGISVSDLLIAISRQHVFLTTVHMSSGSCGVIHRMARISNVLDSLGIQSLVEDYLEWKKESLGFTELKWEGLSFSICWNYLAMVLLHKRHLPKDR